MKTFLSLVLPIVVVTTAAAAPSRSDNHILKGRNLGRNMPDEERLKRNIHHQIQEQKKKQLKEIRIAVNFVSTKLSKQILDKWVPDDLTSSCTPEELCKAGKVLATFKAKDLGLEKWEWILHRQLLAYTKGTDCSKTQTATVESTLSSLLQNIYECAHRELNSIS
ncbi:hypothetical protein SRHO_G00096480 [Serrasalmus rhombeus]